MRLPSNQCSSHLLRGRNPRAGFALLITVTLLAFIVIILLGLAVYTRVETSVAGNTQRQAQARENALLALNVALGQLQLHAGPDTRVTATAQNFGGINGTRFYTGVWSSNATETDTPGTPRTWLVSGNELRVPDTSDGAAAGSTVSAPLAVTPAAPGSQTVELVGRNSTGSATRNGDYVIAPLTEIKASGVPGTPPSASTTIGRYAYWVGDQGVKAPVAVPDGNSAIAFAPWDSADLRARIRQQIPTGAGATDATSGAPVFEPRDGNNASLVANQKVTANSQFAFLRNASNTPLGLARVQQNFHLWSPNNFAVLANTKLGGLRQDLSLMPSLLGDAFVAWANYPAYMEKPSAVTTSSDSSDSGGGGTTDTPITTTPSILPAYGDDPIRRRHMISAQVRGGNGSHQVAPILTYFSITFNVRTVNESKAKNSPLEVRAAWRLSLWNPYSSALVPENLRLDVSGLPTSVQIVNDSGPTPVPVGSFSLRSTSDSASYGSPLKISLPWDATNIPSDSPAEDRHSWLPGRVYTWRSIENTDKAEVPTEGYASRFYTRSFVATGETNQGVQRPINVSVDGSDNCHLVVNGASALSLTLYVIRDGTPVRIAAFTSPPFADGFSTAVHAINASTYQFAYVFRLKESVDTPANLGEWLTTEGLDLRRSRLPAEAFVFGPNGDSPEQYENTLTSLVISAPGRLLDRATNSWTYNEDVPIFELPRAPLLSMGALQHFRIVASRPFMIGNPWGVKASLNSIPLGELFDRFFFSGFTDGVTPSTSATGDLIAPNALLKPLRNSDGTKPTIDEVRATILGTTTDTTTTDSSDTPPDETPVDGTPSVPSLPGGRSSKFFLQSAAFNLNSVNVGAWAAVLRGVRFPTAQQAFSYLDASADTGTAADSATTTVPASGDAQFFRFSQSAQETYKAEAGASAPGEDVTPPNTHLFRRGMRTLTAAQVAALAAKVVELIGAKQTAADPAGGPFRSLEEFISPSTLFAGVDTDGNVGASRSLLEAAIADAGINADIAEFSSQWLTQADVMTALAPILFPRSDTFVIRTYGEAVNPAKLNANGSVPTDAVEGRAWCEAVVQRVPEYFDRSDPADTLITAFDAPGNPDDASSAPTQAHQLNQLYGRRFKVVSFRWLTRSDI